MRLFGHKRDESHHQLHTDLSDPKTESFAILIGSGGKTVLNSKYRVESMFYPSLKVNYHYRRITPCFLQHTKHGFICSLDWSLVVLAYGYISYSCSTVTAVLLSAG